MLTTTHMLLNSLVVLSLLPFQDEQRPRTLSKQESKTAISKNKMLACLLLRIRISYTGMYYNTTRHWHL